MVDIHEIKALNTAINALEFALHPRTDDTEVLAAVRGWRAKVGGQRLGDVCRNMWDKRTAEGMDLAEFRMDWADRFTTQQERITELMGEIVDLRKQVETATADVRQELVAANYALVAAQEEVKKLRAKLGKAEAKGGLPAVLDPNAKQPTPEPLYPLGHTDLIYVEFGDLKIPEPGWNEVKRRVAKALIDEGVSIDDIANCMNGVLVGETENKNYRFFSDVGLSIKNENTSEIYRGLKRAAIEFKRSLKIVADSKDKAPRRNGKAGGRFSRASAFPGDRLTLELRQIDPAPIEEPTPESPPVVAEPPAPSLDQLQ